MAKKGSMVMAVVALAIFVVGGLATFTGLGLLAFMKNRDVLGLGTGYSMGVSLVIFGLLASIGGVIIMRIFRNRF